MDHDRSLVPGDSRFHLKQRLQQDIVSTKSCISYLEKVGSNISMSDYLNITTVFQAAKKLVGGFANIFGILISKLGGNSIHFDLHIFFQMGGCFNRQLDISSYITLRKLTFFLKKLGLLSKGKVHLPFSTEKNPEAREKPGPHLKYWLVYMDLPISWDYL